MAPQVDHVAGFLEGELAASGEADLVVVGHSIGAWVALEAGRRVGKSWGRSCATAHAWRPPHARPQHPTAALLRCGLAGFPGAPAAPDTATRLHTRREPRATCGGARLFRTQAVRRLGANQRRVAACIGLMPYLTTETQGAVQKAALIRRWSAPHAMR